MRIIKDYALLVFALVLSPIWFFPLLGYIIYSEVKLNKRKDKK